MRRSMNKRVDRKVFRNTAVRSKRINVYPSVMRGGIRM